MMNQSGSMLATIISAFVIPISGCGSATRADSAALAGRVTIDHTPVHRGSMTFMPVERGIPAFCEIREGTYAVANAPKGRVRVVFSAARKSGREIEVYSSRVPEVIDVLPPSLRDGIEINIDSDDPSRDFVLSSKKKEPR